MPHSSGGGSHSSGSHSGSSSSSYGSHGGGSSRPKEPVVRSTPCYGYSRYAFYTHGGINYRYVRDTPDSPTSVRLQILFLIPFILVGIFVLLMSFRVVHPIDPISYDSAIIIEDNLNVLSDNDKEKLRNAFEDFKDKTGIACALVTDTNESWVPYYTGIDNYAYDVYVNHWLDEKHWLFVYTQPATVDNATSFVDWYWEGMQGDDTDSIITQETADDFNTTVQRYLSMSRYSVGDAFTAAIEELTKTVKANGVVVDLTPCVFAIVWFMIIGIVFATTIGSTLSNIKKDTKEIETLHKTGIRVVGNPIEATCEYCGGVYIHGMHLTCPHCGATIRVQQTV